ncbi:hypothetical protein N1851_002779 [Merluccius polli]|uniref:Uncharacterized protein n=1 Tax=Merluccius polli TaxID=89951 RepID=A0AA47N9F7_MERPO|nr:hypothetical protein N1851_002779 [Merluccius polli]
MVWKTYKFSPKSMRELKALGADLGVNVLVPSGVKGMWWLPHVSRALETFLRPRKDNHGQFTAVYCHMDHLAGSSANADIAGQARKAICGLENLLVNTEVMAERPKPGGRLSQLQAALRQQRMQQDEQAEMPIYKFQTVEDLIQISVEGPSLEDFARECGKLVHPRAKGKKATLQVLAV